MKVVGRDQLFSASRAAQRADCFGLLGFQRWQRQRHEIIGDGRLPGRTLNAWVMSRGTVTSRQSSMQINILLVVVGIKLNITFQRR
jgi:hypothetical protein